MSRYAAGMGPSFVKRIAALNCLRAHALSATCAALLMAACGAQTEAEQLAAARQALQAGDFAAAAVHSKQTLQTWPNSAEARLILAESLHNAGDSRAALLELDKVAQADLDPVRVATLKGRALLSANEPRRVIEELGRITLPDARASAEVRSMVAAAHATLGARSEAEAAARSALEMNPRDASARRLLARLAAMAGDLPGAREWMDSLLTDTADQHETQQLLGELLWRGGSDVAGAEAAFRKALAIQPTYLPAHTALSALLLLQGQIEPYRAQLKQLQTVLPQHPVTLLYTARLALWDGNLDGAREMSQALLRQKPDEAEALELAGMVELRRNNIVQADAHLNKAVLQAPTATLPRQLLAEVQIRAGQPQRALVTLRPLLDQSPSADVLSLAGQAHLLLGDSARAEAAFSRASQANPQDVRIQTAIAVSQIADGRPDVGLSRLDMLAARSPIETPADMARISARIDRREWKQALQAIDELLAKSPGSTLAHHLRSRMLMELKDPVRARESWEAALRIDPAFFDAAASLALLDVSEGQPERAQQRVRSFLQANPRDARAMAALADLRRRAGAPADEVQNLLQEAIRADGTAPGPRRLLVDHHLQRGDIAAARSAAQEAVAALPDDPLLLDALGLVHLAAGDAAQAIATFNRILSAQPGLVQPLLRLSDTHARLRDFDAARQVLRRTLEASPRHVEAQRELARIAMLDGKPDEALRVAKTVQQQRPDEPLGHLMESDVLAQQGRWPGAIAAARAALDRQRTSWIAVQLHSQLLQGGRQPEATRLATDWMREHPNDADFLRHLGTRAMAASDYVEAEALYRRVLAIQERDAIALNNVAWSMVQRGAPGALAYAERAVQAAPGHPALLDTLASAQHAQGQTAQAIETQRRAVALAPDAPDLELNLARLLIASGSRDEARTLLTKLSRLGGRFAQQDQVATLLAQLR